MILTVYHLSFFKDRLYLGSVECYRVLFPSPYRSTLVPHWLELDCHMIESAFENPHRRSCYSLTSSTTPSTHHELSVSHKATV